MYRSPAAWGGGWKSLSALFLKRRNDVRAYLFLHDQLYYMPLGPDSCGLIHSSSRRPLSSWRFIMPPEIFNAFILDEKQGIEGTPLNKNQA